MARRSQKDAATTGNERADRVNPYKKNARAIPTFSERGLPANVAKDGPSRARMQGQSWKMSHPFYAG
eukprot:8675289-Pyramimonas_sp.AAC.1